MALLDGYIDDTITYGSGPVFTFFTLRTIANLDPSTVRMSFTLDPKRISALNPDDALNPANWTITGPAVNSVVSVAATLGDTKSVDLTLSTPLIGGLWTVSVANVESTGSASLDIPTSLSFFVPIIPSSPINLVSIVQNGIECLRLTFDVPPIQLDVTGVHDALNPANYTVEGPYANLVSSVVPVKGDPWSVDVYLKKPLIKGGWTLHVNNVEAA